VSAANARFALGFLALPAFAAISEPLAKLVACAAFFACAAAFGKRPRLIPAIAVISAVTAVSVLAPSGRVLFRLIGFSVTEGALLVGLDRGLMVEGLLFLSKASIDAGLRFPGSFGALLSEAFLVLASFQGRKREFDPRRPIESIDNILVELYASSAPRMEAGEGSRRLSPLALVPALTAWAAFAAERAGLFGA
jgi:heptaprenyl diphosphate synthase